MLNLDAEAANLGLVAALVAVLVCVIMLVVFKLKLNGADKQRAASDDQAQHNQQLLDGFDQGMLHLDDEGQVLYANKVAAVLLGSSQGALQGKSLSSLLPEDAHKVVAQAMSSNIPAGFQTSLKGQQTLWMTITPKGKSKTMAAVMSLVDVSRFQRKIDDARGSIATYKGLCDAASIGQFDLVLADDSLTHNAVVSEWLGTDIADWTGLQQQVRHQDWHEFVQARAVLEQGEQVSFVAQIGEQEHWHKVQVVGLVSTVGDDGKPATVRWLLTDISEQHTLERHKQVIQQRMRGVLHAINTACYLVDENTTVVDVNPAFDRLFGTNAMALRGQPVDSIEALPEAILALHQGSDLMAASSGPKEITVTLADQQEHILSQRLLPLKSAEGQRVGSIVMIEDVTEKRAQEAAMEAERQRFTHILDMAPLAIALIDKDDHIIQANQVTTERLGLSEQELQSVSFYDLFNDGHNAARAAKQLQQDGQLRNYAVKLKGKDGHLFPSELHVDEFDRNAGQHLVWIADVSDKQLHQDKFDSLLQHSSIPMAVLSEQGFEHLNPAALEFFHADSGEELAGLFPYDESLNVDEQSAQRLRQKITQIRTDGRAQSMPWQHQRKDQILPCHATFVPMFKGRQLESILCMWLDMRAVKQADAARQEAISRQAEAERIAQEKQQQLESSQDQLASKTRSLQDTQSKLEAVTEDLSAKESAFSTLQAEHASVTDHLNKLQQDYQQSREKLAQTEQSNAELEEQLAQSSEKVSALQQQRNQIADALQYSEQQHKRAQQQLLESEQLTEKLQKEQQQQAEQINQYEQQVSGLKGEITDKDRQLHEVSGQINTLQSQLTSSSQTSDKLREQLQMQRKASEEAARQRRELEQIVRQAESELGSKARHIEHLQHEMSKFEELSQQEKGDMEKQQKALADELAAKHQQLEAMQTKLEETLQQSEQEKAEKEAQQQRLQQLEKELNDVEARTAEQQQKMAEADEYWKAQQAELQEALKAKQQQLQDTLATLEDTTQQTEAERAERARQEQIYAKLEKELAEMEQRAAEQNAKMAQSDKQWQEHQKSLSEELEAKQQQLMQTRQQLDEQQRQADAEKHQRDEQQQALEQLKQELRDVESRASKQKEMMEGSDEQWRQHHAEIEAQKQQLQEALAQAQQQNQAMQEKLQGNLEALQVAETKVSETTSGEQKLQGELQKARQQAEALQAKLAAQEAQESSLQQQLAEQQKALEERERNIKALEEQQQALSDSLQTVQKEYDATKQDLSSQDSNQSELAEQLKALEQELQDSKAQLDTKESALQDAQSKLQDSQSKLAEQEQALLEASKAELKQAQEEAPKAPKELPPYAKLPLPSSPSAWFDLLPFLQRNPDSGPLAEGLNKLLDELDGIIEGMGQALDSEDNGKLLLFVHKLNQVAERINSAPLLDLAARLEADSRAGELDNIAISWPSMEQSLQNTQRVIYSHLHQG
ncbi:PAS domain S-box protein [Aestuariibacter halophilus]|uniref:PAS domain S-box protein n=1 Tax=Fluctibacter halophilus TaxID=226011 RepID=A0ABS8GC55_9ALTE|nr:PAS domain S-box protein [Aestuariibacter halophilus]MCC2618117.1 PAS domain S-box protein [Aestuariibacter halophilus]